MTKRQSTHLPNRLPACGLALVGALVLGFPGLQGQDRYRVRQQENFRREPRPNGRLLATVRAGSELQGGETRAGWVQIDLEGWIWAASLRPLQSSEFDFEVAAANGENLRRRPNGPVVARLATGFRLESLGRDGQWVHVRRPGWMWGRSLERVATDQAPPPTPPPTPTQAASTPDPAPDALVNRTVTMDSAVLYRTPGDHPGGTLATGMPVRVLERSGQWLKVRTEGWVREDELRPTSPDVLVGVSGAEVRARPGDYEGRVVEWTVQYIALRTADDLRQEFAPGQRYLLARGPVPEAGFVYIGINADQVEALSRVAPLAELVVTARILHGRSRFLGNPVLELLDWAVRQP